MPLIETKGAASAQGFGEFAQSSEPVYIESCFSTYLYTGNGSTQTITNGIDLAGEGGLVWIKDRSVARSNVLFDTIRGATYRLISNSTAAQNNETTALGGFNSDGFSTGYKPEVNESGETYASWTFRKAEKFFDVVTWTGTGSATTISHNLGSVPGCIIVKRTDTTGNWQVYHRSVGNTKYLVLNSTAAEATSSTRWNNTTPTSTVFSIGTEATVNASGGTYVAYLFAHNAGGFGLSGTDNVISCGSYTTDGSGNATINLGYEPQWLLVKASSTTSDWYLLDTMRGMSNANPAENARLYANTSGAEASTGGTSGIVPTATGFNHLQYIAANATYIYIAIRRGPMKVPTSGTSVFSPIASSAATGTALTTNFPVDAQFGKYRSGSASWSVVDRLRGVSTTSTEMGLSLATNSTAAEGTASGGDSNNWGSTGFSMPSNLGGISDIFYNFRRAPGFMDEICFSGSGANKTEAHNLGVPPELWLVKSRSGATQWVFGSSLLAANEKIVMPSPNGRVTDATVWNSTYPTASVLSLGTSSTTNASGQTFVGYLWATVAGVSKVGTYTGNGSSQTIDCGFTGGSRFVMIIRATASTAQDIYIWDSARGIVAGNDPRLSLNTTAAEVTSLDTIDTAASGFVVNTDASNVNVNGSVYLYLSIA